MDVPYLKNEFFKTKPFLKKLFENNPRRTSALLQKAKISELNILVKILFLICTGKISIRKNDFKLIKQSKRLNYFKQHFDSKKSFLKILKTNNIEKIAILKKFSALYSSLLYTMFNKI